MTVLTRRYKGLTMEIHRKFINKDRIINTNFILNDQKENHFLETGYSD